jgi:hypothetical protein
MEAVSAAIKASTAARPLPTSFSASDLTPHAVSGPAAPASVARPAVPASTQPPAAPVRHARSVKDIAANFGGASHAGGDHGPAHAHIQAPSSSGGAAAVRPHAPLLASRFGSELAVKEPQMHRRCETLARWRLAPGAVSLCR